MTNTPMKCWIEECYSPSRKSRFFRVYTSWQGENIVVGDYFSRADACRALESARRFK